MGNTGLLQSYEPGKVRRKSKKKLNLTLGLVRLSDYTRLFDVKLLSNSEGKFY